MLTPKGTSCCVPLMGSIEHGDPPNKLGSTGLEQGQDLTLLGKCWFCPRGMVLSVCYGPHGAFVCMTERTDLSEAKQVYTEPGESWSISRRPQGCGPGRWRGNGAPCRAHAALRAGTRGTAGGQPPGMAVVLSRRGWGYVLAGA